VNGQIIDKVRTPIAERLVEPHSSERNTKEKAKVWLARYLLEIRFGEYQEGYLLKVLSELARQSKRPLHILLVKIAESRTAVTRSPVSGEDCKALFRHFAFNSLIATDFATLDLVLSGRLAIKDVPEHVQTISSSKKQVD